jgi:hypothetical protein
MVSGSLLSGSSILLYFRFLLFVFLSRFFSAICIFAACQVVMSFLEKDGAFVSP